MLPHSNIENIQSSTPPYSSNSDIPYQTNMPNIRFPNFSSGELHSKFPRWISPPSNPPCYPNCGSLEKLDSSDISHQTLCESIRFSHIPSATQPVSLRPEYESSSNVYSSYIQPIHRNNFQHYTPIPMQTNSSSYRLVSQFSYSSPFINGCNSFIPSSPFIERIKHCPSQPVISQFNQNRDPLLEHNYAKPSDGVKTDTDKESTSICIDSNKLLPKKRTLSQTESQLESQNIEKKAVPKKKRNYHPNREFINKALTLGFSRELIKIQNQNGELKNSVIYKTPDGKILNKKQDVKLYLNENPNIDLKNENFSFDSRLSLTPKKARETISKKNLTLHDNSFNSITSNDIAISNSKPRPKKKLPSQSETPTKVSVTLKKTLNLKHRKLISKYFKKISDDSKYFDGLHSGAYRRKLSSLEKINQNIIINDNRNAKDNVSIYSNALCLEEFLATFSSHLNVYTELCTAADIISSLTITDFSTSLFSKMFSQLLKIAVIYDNFASEVNALFYLDNIHSLQWDWLLVNEIFRLYFHAKTKTLIGQQPLSDSSYHLYLMELLSVLDDTQYIYTLKPDLKLFALRYIIDQICSTCTFASIINEIVESVARNRRDKYHLDTKIRQLKVKIVPSSNITPKTPQDVEENPAVEQVEKNADSILEIETPPQVDEVLQFEQDRDKLRADINNKCLSLRVLYLGSDRYGREYHYSDNQKVVFVEGLSNQPGVAQNKFLSLSSRRSKNINIPPPCHFKELLGISSFYFEKLGLGHDSSIENFDAVFNIPTLEKPSQLDQINSNELYINSLIRMLVQCPKMIKNVSEEELPLFVESFSRSYDKNRKKTVNVNEFGEGWWLIRDQSTFNDFAKCLNQRGIREHNLHKSLSRNQDLIFDLPDEKLEYDINSSISYRYSSSENISNDNLLNMANTLILSELKQISVKMDKYLMKINVEPEVAIQAQYEQIISNSYSDAKDIIQKLITAFVQCCERKFDRPWLSKWMESIYLYSGPGTIYLFCQSLKLKIDPNSKICKICNHINDSLVITECHMCLLSAHESCLEEPMRKSKKTKMICSGCFKEVSSRLTRICKICNVKTGKTISCSECNDYFHFKCLGNKPKNKLDAIICESCVIANKISKPKTYTKPDIFFANVSFKTFSTQCQELLKTLLDNKDAQPFIEPVDLTVPSYYDIIKKPMDFKTINKKIKNTKYKTVTQFYNDIIQIFENCHIYNDDNSKIGKSGIRLQKIFEKEWAKLCSTFSV
ncbi:hypothetical protein HZS_3652 [Henneguya salminicola]|nr:hypothetical protein HZS_3652 [Henneguya salminicola]